VGSSGLGAVAAHAGVGGGAQPIAIDETLAARTSSRRSA
jgi:acyl dehydratase